jgi:hypothetical protein
VLSIFGVFLGYEVLYLFHHPWCFRECVRLDVLNDKTFSIRSTPYPSHLTCRHWLSTLSLCHPTTMIHLSSLRTCYPPSPFSTPTPSTSTPNPTNTVKAILLLCLHVLRYFRLHPSSPSPLSSSRYARPFCPNSRSPTLTSCKALPVPHWHIGASISHFSFLCIREFVRRSTCQSHIDHG